MVTKLLNILPVTLAFLKNNSLASTSIASGDFEVSGISSTSTSLAQEIKMRTIRKEGMNLFMVYGLVETSGKFSYPDAFCICFTFLLIKNCVQLNLTEL